MDISWGRWNSTVDENWVVVTQVDENLVVLSAGDYFAAVNPTDIAQLTGSHQYATGIASSFIGSGSAGDISDLVASMNVDFSTGSITNGNLQLSVADQIWSIDFDGDVRNGAVSLIGGDGSLLDSSGLVSNAINANLGGVFAGPSGEVFVGGFGLLDEMNPFNSVEGIFTLER